MSSVTTSKAPTGWTQEARSAPQPPAYGVVRPMGRPHRPARRLRRLALQASSGPGRASGRSQSHPYRQANQATRVGLKGAVVSANPGDVSTGPSNAREARSEPRERRRPGLSGRSAPSPCCIQTSCRPLRPASRIRETRGFRGGTSKFESTQTNATGIVEPRRTNESDPDRHKRNRFPARRRNPRRDSRRPLGRRRGRERRPR